MQSINTKKSFNAIFDKMNDDQWVEYYFGVVKKRANNEIPANKWGIITSKVCDFFRLECAKEMLECLENKKLLIRMAKGWQNSEKTKVELIFAFLLDELPDDHELIKGAEEYYSFLVDKNILKKLKKMDKSITKELEQLRVSVKELEKEVNVPRLW